MSCVEGLTHLQSCPNGLHFSLSLRRSQPLEHVERLDRAYLPSELHIFYEWWQQIQRVGPNSTTVCPFALTGNYQPDTCITCVAQCADTIL